MKTYKVYGRYTYSSPQKRIIVAAKTQKEAARLFGISMYEFRTYTSETGNDKELEVALANPGVIFISPEQRLGVPQIFIPYEK